MPRDYSYTEDGRPTAAHHWDEQFFAAKRAPEIKELQARIAQLEVAQGKATCEGRMPIRGWQREIAWRKQQIDTLRAQEKIENPEKDEFSAGVN